MTTYFQVARSNMLFLDLDSKKAEQQYRTQLRGLKRMGWIKVIKTKRWRSRSGHTHIALYLSSTLHLFEIIALQVILGSDPTRERMNWGRVRSNAPCPILFISRRKRSL